MSHQHTIDRRFVPVLAPIRLMLVCVLAALSAACAVQPPGPLSDCKARFRHADQIIDAAHARDRGPAPITGFPYLRVDRLLASFRDETDTPERVSAWVEALAALDAGSREAELRNAGPSDSGALKAELDDCRQKLVNGLVQDPRGLARLRRTAEVRDDYVTGWRILGLYPLTALPVSAGIARWHRKTRDTFALPLARLPTEGRRVRWHSVPAGLDPRPYDPPLDALGIPRPDAATLQRLFERHAPVWELDLVDDNDRIGTAVWRGKPAVDSARATEYRRLSHTRFGDKVLLQLNYVVWFRARPGDDIYAGDIDGLNWRVTLGPDGEPWLYDSIHNCGCYHLFFPTEALRLRRPLPPGETPLVLPTPPRGPLVVRLDSGRHFIQRVHSALPQRPALPLATLPYDRLRALPAADGTWHSFFGAHGLVAGSERPERFLLWPMGIRSPGAMRQWGRHATAFVGRRHFDDPYLLQTLFEAAAP